MSLHGLTQTYESSPPVEEPGRSTVSPSMDLTWIETWAEEKTGWLDATGMFWNAKTQNPEEYATKYYPRYESHKPFTPHTWRHARWQSNIVEHGLKDSKDRAIGGRVVIESLAAGDFIVETYVTRDGKGFGAIPRGTKAPTFEAAKVLAVKKLQEQAKRFAKAVAKGEGRQFARKRAV